MTAMTRGPLPARVYWTRRLLALAVALGLVVAVVQVASLLGGGAPGQPDRAAPAAAEVDPTETADESATEAGEPASKQDQKKKRKKQRARDREPELASPEGACTDRDIAVTPSVEGAVGGSAVVFTVDLRTITAAACTWEVSPDSLTVKVTSGEDDIWFSSECRRSIPTRDVIIRNNANTPVEVTWSARRSDEGCTRFADWALPGWYHVEAAVFAGEPSDVQFRLTAPDPEVVTETVPPDPKGDQKRGGKKPDGKNRDRKNREREG